MICVVASGKQPEAADHRLQAKDHLSRAPDVRPAWLQGTQTNQDLVSIMDRNEVVSQFVSLTNCSDNEASFYLEAANYDLDRAVAMFYGARLEEQFWSNAKRATEPCQACKETA